MSSNRSRRESVGGVTDKRPILATADRNLHRVPPENFSNLTGSPLRLAAATAAELTGAAFRNRIDGMETISLWIAPAITLALFGWLIVAIRSLRREQREDMREVRNDFGEVRDRLSRLEGYIAGRNARADDPPPAAAE